MFEIEDATEYGIDHDGGFAFEYLESAPAGQVRYRITNIWDADGNPCKVSEDVRRQMGDYITGLVPDMLAEIDTLMAEARAGV